MQPSILFFCFIFGVGVGYVCMRFSLNQEFLNTNPSLKDMQIITIIAEILGVLITSMLYKMIIVNTFQLKALSDLPLYLALAGIVIAWLIFVPKKIY
jgi:hypothetical protein